MHISTLETTLIVPERTAIATGVSKSATDLSKNTIKPASVLDYGAGRLRNAYFLLEQGFNVSILDTPLQMCYIRDYDQSNFEAVYTIHDQIHSYYEAILCSYVLNVIPFIEERNQVMQKLYDLLSDGGCAYLEVRKRTGIMKTKNREPFEDGFVIGGNKTKTFQKPFEKQEFVEYVASFGFVVSSISSTSDSWSIIAQKPMTNNWTAQGIKPSQSSIHSLIIA